ncbi:hypothetical protein EST38_g4696 [Candolleomyces aberdarensis]|uniref:BTB domain-containing protein n=1 Tax=Candolleomyces aberdarensis TaxID=2316362 RepID=A0A4Q2DMC2_9AGAR|nr:hypothetical protein EST38_g4696 [Candolleomyces aberdarensis]
MGSSDNRKKGKFFYDSVVLQVEDTLHQIPRYHLETWSQTFKDMFQISQGDNANGSSDECPIILPGCTNDEFESLLTVLFTPGAVPPTLSKDQWISVLKLATMWDMAQFRELAIGKLSSLNLTPIQNLQLGKTYKVASWIVEGYTALLQDTQTISLDDLGASLGWETAARILWAAKKFKTKRFVVIGREAWQCLRCSRSGTLLAAGSLLRPVFAIQNHEEDVYEDSYEDSTGEPSLECSECPYSGNRIQVELSTLEGSGPDSFSAAVREVFAEELKAAY